MEILSFDNFDSFDSFFNKKGTSYGTHHKSRGTHFKIPNCHANCLTQTQLETCTKKKSQFCL